MNANRLGSLLVFLQFSLLAALLWLVVWQRPSLLSWLLWAASAATGLWAVSVNRLGNFNIHPQPRAGGHLVVQGPYRWVRHPMYTSVMLLGLGCVVAVPHLTAWVLLSALVGVLTVKASLEESWMAQLHPGYPAYCQHTKRFVPYLI